MYRVRPDKISDALLTDISDMYMDLVFLSGKDNGFLSDFLAAGVEPDSNAKEILIGHTNRPETEQVLSQLAGNECAIAVVGNKIVITGIADSLTPKALAYFADTYLGKDADGMIEGDLFHRIVVDTAIIVDKGEPVYTLVRQESGYEGATELCYDVLDAVEAASGAYLTIKTDRLTTGASHDDEALEILFGDVNYDQTQQHKSNVAPDAYSIDFVGNKIIIYAWSSEGLERAVEAFADLLRYACYTDAEGRTTVCIVKESITGKNESLNFYTDVPYEANGRRYGSVYNAYDGAMMLYWSDADEKMLNAYFKSVADMGYAKYQELDNNSIHSITCQKGGLSVHMYYLKRVKELRVIAQNKAQLPTNSYSYEKLCSPAVTQLGLYHDQETYTGMGYLIRLEDGTFVVIDGGNALEYNAKLLYETMLEQKPDELDEIIITAWIVTHAHGDHNGVFEYFAKHYKDKVTVKQLIGNDISDFVYSTNDFGKRNFTYSAAAKGFNGCVYTKAHTGQQFFFPGATFTVMYTHEDVYPKTFKLYNDVASMMISADIENTRFLWLADMEKTAAQRFKNMYDKDMKCDVLQVGHHGIGGGSYDVYRLCDPDIALWPAGQQVIDRENVWDWTQNAWIRDNVEQIYIHKDGSYTIWFDKNIDMSGVHGTEDIEGSHTKNY